MWFRRTPKPHPADSLMQSIFDESVAKSAEVQRKLEAEATQRKQGRTAYIATSWSATFDQIREVSGVIEGRTVHDMPELGSIVKVMFGATLGRAYVVSLRGDACGAWRADVQMTGAPIPLSGIE